jgi:hypothetical protein
VAEQPWLQVCLRLFSLTKGGMIGLDQEEPPIGAVPLESQTINGDASRNDVHGRESIRNDDRDRPGAYGRDRDHDP